MSKGYATITWWGHDGESNGYRVIDNLGIRYLQVIERDVGMTKVFYETARSPSQSIIHVFYATVEFSST